MENSLLAIFDEIWPKTMYRVFGPIFEQLKKFLKNLNLIGISSNFLCNISTCICIRKNYKNEKFSPSQIWPKTLYYILVQGLWPDF